MSLFVYRGLADNHMIYEKAGDKLWESCGNKVLNYIKW